MPLAQALKENSAAMGAILLNTVSSVSIIAVNKIVFGNGFNFPTFLCALHFIFTFGGLNIAKSRGFFELKELPFKPVAALSIAFASYLVFSNLSLAMNEAGMAQTFKIMITPTVCFMESFLLKKKFGRKYWIAIGFICLGVAICTVERISVNPMGLLVGFISIISSASYQVLSGLMQKKLKCSSSQLLYYQVPLSLLFLCFIFPFFDSPIDIILQVKTLSAGIIFAVFMTCVLSFFVNLSVFLVIGRTSAVTYNVASHSKTVLNYIIAFTLFKENASISTLMGIVLTLSGIFLYSYHKLKDQEAEKRARQQSEQDSNELVEALDQLGSETPNVLDDDEIDIGHREHVVADKND